MLADRVLVDDDDCSSSACDSPTAALPLTLPSRMRTLNAPAYLMADAAVRLQAVPPSPRPPKPWSDDPPPPDVSPSDEAPTPQSPANMAPQLRTSVTTSDEGGPVAPVSPAPRAASRRWPSCSLHSLFACCCFEPLVKDE